MTTCTTAGCTRKHLARGLCSTHYNTWHRAQRRHVITCEECGQQATVDRKGARFCCHPCANRYNMRTWRLAVARQRGQAVVLYSPPPRRPAQVHVRSKRVLVSGRCLVCKQWFVSGNRRDQTCSTTCRDLHALDSKRRGKHRRRARQRNAYVADVNRRHVYERDGWRCHLCRRPVDPNAKAPDPRSATIDHVIPLACGGTHEPLNCRTACFACNTRKGARGGGEQLLLIA